MSEILASIDSSEKRYDVPRSFNGDLHSVEITAICSGEN